MNKRKIVPEKIKEVLGDFNIRVRSYISHDDDNIYTMEGTILNAFTNPVRAKINVNPSDETVHGRVITDHTQFEILYS